MLTLYKNIKSKRMELGMSQQELADLVGYSGKSMISKIERGEVDLSQTMIQKFADALKTTPGELMGWENGTDNTSEMKIDYYVHPDENSKPGIIITTEKGEKCLFDISSIVYSSMESVAKMSPEQQELVNNMVGGSKKVIYVENPYNKNKITTVEEAREYLESLHSFAAFNPNEISDEALIKIANTMYESNRK